MFLTILQELFGSHMLSTQKIKMKQLHIIVMEPVIVNLQHSSSSADESCYEEGFSGDDHARE
jgi:hypothetical protein